MRPLQLLRVQVAVRERHEPPAHGEQQPAADEGGGEDDEREAPLEVDQRGEHVLQEAALLADVLVRQVARAVLGDEARLVHAVPEHGLAGHARGEARQTELLRDDALPRQHLLLNCLPGKKKHCFSPPRLQSCVITRGHNMSTCSAPPLLSTLVWRCSAVTVAHRLPPLSSSEAGTLLRAPVDVEEQLPESRDPESQSQS